ncbi:MAG: DUF134 domain-containing protein [Firmicutes bacterium]|nr:DUF134 domain-containing protein [Bacillota bacterium]
MPRPKRLRSVCFLPEYTSFGSLDKTQTQIESVILTVEELESIRLIDLEGFDQEQAAQTLDVSRGTFQRIYHEAKHKIAEMLICGKNLFIQEGDYRLCDHQEHQHRRRCGEDKTCCGEKE